MQQTAVPGDSSELRPRGTAHRVKAALDVAAGAAPPSVSPFIVQASPLVAKAFVAAESALPAVNSAYQGAKALYAQLPLDVLTCCIGIIFCFFGGYFPSVFGPLFRMDSVAVDQVDISLFKCVCSSD